MQVNRQPGGKGESKVSDVMHAEADANDGSGPLHVQLRLQPAESSPLLKLDDAVLIGKIRKRARRVGVRINLTMQLLPEESAGGGAGDGAKSVLHATPMRANRALALRHIMRLCGFTMGQAVFLCTPASVAPKGERAPGTMLGALASDMQYLIEGAQRVVVVPPRTEVSLNKKLSDSGVRTLHSFLCSACC